jgi:L-ascorbate metabolism protein UlaG (beta-lactamase superfamily)
MWTMLKLLCSLLVLFLVLAFSIGWALSAPGYAGVKSANFDGKYFYNENKAHNGVLVILKWLLFRKPGPWSASAPAAHTTYPKPKERIGGQNFSITFVNHATVLIQIAGVNILTDPIWSDRCSPVAFFGPKRVRDPGINFEDLPPIDFVLISHNHYDHLDLPTLDKLVKRDDPDIIVGLGIKKYLEKYNITKVSELQWWHKLDFGGLNLWSVPAQHFSGRGLGDRNKTLWMGFVIESPHAKIYFAGDTGFGPHFQQIHEHFGDIDIALLPIGAFLPVAIMQHMHMQPREALEAAHILGARHSFAIHFGTFPLADDAQNEPVEELQKAQALLLEARPFEVLDFGEQRDFEFGSPPL